VAAALDGVGVPWCVVGGWSIDLLLGEQTRAHEDLEIAVLRRDHRRVRAHLSPQLAFRAVGDGAIRSLAPDEELPPTVHQSWGLDEAAQLWRVDVMAEPGDDETWVFRRDERITAPRTQMVARTADGIPYLLPHGALFFKAKATREKDEHDLAVALPHLDASQRAWLREALTREHPDHPWTRKISGHPDPSWGSEQPEIS